MVGDGGGGDAPVKRTGHVSVYTFLGWALLVVALAFIGGLALIGLAYCMGLL